MSLEKGDASSCEDVIYSSDSVSTCSGKLIACAVKAGIEDLIVVSSKSLNTLSTSDIPELACSIDTSSEAVVSCEIELATGELSCVTLKSEDALSSTNIPDFCSVIK
jgi:hypothetical protein